MTTFDLALFSSGLLSGFVIISTILFRRRIHLLDAIVLRSFVQSTIIEISILILLAALVFIPAITTQQILHLWFMVGGLFIGGISAIIIRRMATSGSLTISHRR